jgi:hypothetical protein
MQKVIAAFVDANQTPPHGARFLVYVLARRCSHALNKIARSISDAQSLPLKPVKGSRRKEVTMRCSQLIAAAGLLEEDGQLLAGARLVRRRFSLQANRSSAQVLCYL